MMSVGPAQHQQHHLLDSFKNKKKSQCQFQDGPKAFGQWAADGWSHNDKLKQK